MPLTETERAQIVSLWGTGCQVSAIAKRVNVTRRTVYQWIRRYEAEGNVKRRLPRAGAPAEQPALRHDVPAVTVLRQPRIARAPRGRTRRAAKPAALAEKSAEVFIKREPADACEEAARTPKEEMDVGCTVLQRVKTERWQVPALVPKIEPPEEEPSRCEEESVPASSALVKLEAVKLEVDIGPGALQPAPADLSPKKEPKEEPRDNENIGSADVQLFDCGVCRTYFLRKTDLIEHERTHTPRHASQCDNCKKVFPAEENFQQHMLLHTCQCDICKKCFKSKLDLSQHMRTHTEKRNYQCFVC